MRTDEEKFETLESGKVPKIDNVMSCQARDENIDIIAWVLKVHSSMTSDKGERLSGALQTLPACLDKFIEIKTSQV